MVIHEIHIYGYGKLENFTIKDLTDLNIVYGENEAGKSTIMSFIHSVLFGFPTKQQSELRYEPKKNAKYGGRLVVRFSSGKAVIERVKGKATGDVHVLLEDGTQGGEELLQNLLSNMDKSLFQAIFSFNLHGLQNVQQMKNDDLGRFLFSTGAIGTDRLLSAENTIQKQLDSLYKPNGKKPYLNEKIKELKDLHQELKKAELQNDQYWDYLTEKDLLEEEISQNRKEMIQQQEQVSKLLEWKRLLPTIREEQNLSEESQQIGEIAFPPNGVSRLNELVKQLHACEQKSVTVEARFKELKQEIENTSVQQELLADEINIQTAVENLPLYEQLKQERNQLALTLKGLHDEMALLRQQLHIPIEESQIAKVNTSIFMKEKTADASRKEQRLKEKKQELDEDFQSSKQELEELEERLTTLNQSLLSDSQRNELMKQKQLAENQALDEQMLTEVENRISRLKGQLLHEEKQEKMIARQNIFQFLILGAIFILVGLWSIFEQQWGILVASIVGLVYLLVFRKKKVSSRKQDIETELSELASKEERIKGKLTDCKGKNVERISQQLDEDQRLSDQYRLIKMKWEQKNEEYEKIIDSYEKWEHESRVHHNLLQQLGKELGLPHGTSMNFIHEAFLLIEKLKNVFLERKRVTERYQGLQKELSQIEKTLNDLAGQYLPNHSASFQNAAYLLKQELKKQQQLFIRKQEKSKKLQELAEDDKQIQTEKEQLKEEISKLLAQVNAESEAKFRKLAEIAERKTAITTRLQEIHRQLSTSSISVEERNRFKAIAMENLEKLLNEDRQKQEGIQQQLIGKQDRLAEVKYQIALLEEGGTYTQLLHQFKLKKSELQEEAKRWAKLAIAKDLLAKAVEQYKNQRLPKMIEHAESYLRFLTEERYIRIHAQKEGNSFLIESCDHTLFEPKELSQATSEQIYVSLRLALATTLYEKYQFPIIIDDSFVNFDHERTKRVVQLLTEIKGHQILLFTCHQHLLDLFHHARVIKLNEKLSSSMQQL